MIITKASDFKDFNEVLKIMLKECKLTIKNVVEE